MIIESCLRWHGSLDVMRAIVGCEWRFLALLSVPCILIESTPSSRNCSASRCLRTKAASPSWKSSDDCAERALQPAYFRHCRHSPCPALNHNYRTHYSTGSPSDGAIATRESP